MKKGILKRIGIAIGVALFFLIWVGGSVLGAITDNHVFFGLCVLFPVEIGAIYGMLSAISWILYDEPKELFNNINNVITNIRAPEIKTDGALSIAEGDGKLSHTETEGGNCQ